MTAYRIAAIPGDGIGNEFIPAGIEVLEALGKLEGYEMRFEHFDWSSERYLKTGAYIPAGGLEKLKSFDAISLRRGRLAGRARPRLALGPGMARERWISPRRRLIPWW